MLMSSIDVADDRRKDRLLGKVTYMVALMRYRYQVPRYDCVIQPHYCTFTRRSVNVARPLVWNDWERKRVKGYMTR